MLGKLGGGEAFFRLEHNFLILLFFDLELPYTIIRRMGVIILNREEE